MYMQILVDLRVRAHESLKNNFPQPSGSPPDSAPSSSLLFPIVLRLRPCPLGQRRSERAESAASLARCCFQSGYGYRRALLDNTGADGWGKLLTDRSLCDALAERGKKTNLSKGKQKEGLFTQGGTVPHYITPTICLEP